ncbi:MAG: substrate-binding domain-containing protein [Saccharofermentanales bacterium]
MKKFIIFIACLIFAISIFMGAKIVYNTMNPKRVGLPDKTANVNVMLGRPSGWKKIVNDAVIDIQDLDIIDGSTATIPITAEILRQFYNYSDENVNQSGFAYHSTTHNAYLNLIYENAKSYYGPTTRIVSLIFVTAPSDEEKQLAKEAKVVMEITPVAKDGFVFITHKDNPIDSLTIEQIQKIYSGEITNWKELGGVDMEIMAYQREQNSGSQTAMQQIVMKEKKLIKPIDTKIHMGMGNLVDAVAEYENGKGSIGYTYYYYINNLYKNDQIKVLKINGISPENANLINSKYPFTTSYYAVLRMDEPVDSPARILRDFLLTKTGQDMVQMAGYCRSVNDK